jgi:hypothetical protein
MSREIPKWLEMLCVALGIPLVYWTLAAIIALALLCLCSCQTLDNWNTERQMYEIEWINGLPMHHGHSPANGAPYEN